MKKGTITIIAVAAVVLGCILWIKGSYNGMVTAEEGVSAAWSQVENVYQRRADLIPNLVATVKGYAAHESSTLEGVVEARSKATQVTVSSSENARTTSWHPCSDSRRRDISRLQKALRKLLS